MTEARDVCVIAGTGRAAELAAPVTGERCEPRAIDRSIETMAATLKLKVGRAGADKAAAAGVFPSHRGRQRPRGRCEEPVVLHVGNTHFDVGGDLRAEPLQGAGDRTRCQDGERERSHGYDGATAG